MKRLYEAIIQQHFKAYTQMLFLAGPRQVGKTTISLTAKKLTGNFVYLNWDYQDHRDLILTGPNEIAQQLELEKARGKKSLIVFDEIHKYSHWKTFIKGFYDVYKDRVNIIVTGSSKLDVYRRGGDSLMGRYFPYRIHPLSVAECVRPNIFAEEYHLPKRIKPIDFQTLLEFGGFPDPFLKRDKQFNLRWQDLRKEQLFRGDLRDMTRIQELHQLEMLAEFIKHQAGQMTSYTSFAKKVRVSVDTIRRWIDTLSTFYYCFTIKPWSKNISRSLIKEPKLYLWDWSDIDDPGARAENFVASHLLKAVHFWTDYGLGNYGLYFLRDKDKREVDFLVTKDEKPWFLVEVKLASNSGISSHIYSFQKQTLVNHAFQVVFDMDYVDVDCFTYHEPVIVPAQTFLSQLI